MSPNQDNESIWRLPDRDTSEARAESVPPSQSTSNLEAAIGKLEIGAEWQQRFEIREKIGRGGMSLVYRAFDHVRDEEVALKFLSPALLQDPAAIKTLINEAKIASTLSHPNILRVFDVQLHQGVYFLQLELLPGQTLRELMESQTLPFPMDRAIELVEGIAEGLIYAHQTTIHRDLKPENIGVTRDGTVQLMDFGIAQLIRHHPSTLQRETITQLQAGTPYYMAPEVLSSDQCVDSRADQFSLAVVAYEMLTGELPIGLAEPLAQKRFDLPIGLTRAIDRALSTQPDRRFATLADFLEAIQKGASSKSWLHTVATRWRRASRLAKITVAVMSLGLLTWWTHHSWLQSVQQRQTQLEQAWSQLQESDVEVRRLAESIEGQKRALESLTHRFEIEQESWQAGYTNQANWRTLTALSNRLDTAQHVWRSLSPQLTASGVPHELSLLDHDAREAINAGEISSFETIVTSLKKQTALMVTQLDEQIHLITLQADIARLLHHCRRLPSEDLTTLNLPSIETRFLKAKDLLDATETQTGRKRLEAIATQLRSFTQNLFQSLDGQFLAARNHWESLFPEIGAPDLHFIANPDAVAEEARNHFEQDQIDTAAMHLRQSTKIYQMWAEEVTTLRQRAATSWAAAGPKFEGLGMRFIRTGGAYWSVWETRVMDFARWLSDDGALAPGDAKFWKQPGFPLTPTQPVVGISRQTALQFATWCGYNLLRQSRPSGKLPLLEEYQEMAKASGLDPNWLTGIYAPNTEWNSEHLRLYYEDNQLDPSKYITPVGLGKPNAAGLYDLDRNVWEWCEDLYRYDERVHASQSVPLRWTLRGGGPFGTSTYHYFEPPEPNTRFVLRKDAIGFRVLLRGPVHNPDGQ